ncbi:uncharacterized protein LOC134196654 isoform X2 [Corticium candelabrum]|uniref:uncharacterized protein LOC134196654 isoform X2 n=1 Tax=Corticium candelabrum TaxID=121492 RepID=UPI002E25326E|nr:uncharacterized protein LOC134196654 isoform X2 [Corticium candelabrum]
MNQDNNLTWLDRVLHVIKCLPSASEQTSDQYHSAENSINTSSCHDVYESKANDSNVSRRCLLSGQEYAKTADQEILKQTHYQMFDTQMTLSKLRVDCLEKEDQKWTGKVQEQMIELLEIWTRRYGCCKANEMMRSHLQDFELEDDFLPWLERCASHSPCIYSLAVAFNEEA